jgi:two-component system sensor histidine kinase PhoQ
MISIHQRVFISALITLCLFLGLSAWILDGFFRQYTESAIKDSLQNHIYSLLATAKEDQQGQMYLPEILPNPKLNQPNSGTRAYVQGEYIQGEKEPYQWFSASTLNSNFDAKLSTKDVPNFTSGQKLYSITATNYSRYIYTISWEDYQSIEQNYLLLVEINRQPLDQQINHFRYQLLFWLGGSALILLMTLLISLSWSLRPLRQGTEELIQIQQGNIKKMSQNYPKELLLLTENINQLIQLSIVRMQRYRNSLGDLTHSLKTPLAIIQGAYDSQDSKQLRHAIAEQLGRINELVEYQLQRASIAGESSDFSKVEINQLIRKIIRSLDKVYAEKQIKTQFIMNKTTFFKADEGDLMELLGNLLDNAYKYGHQKITVRLQRNHNSIEVFIEDDGHGIDEKLHLGLLQRGSRADTLAPGHGIGLGIVNDITKQYHGQIELSQSKQLQGLQVKVILPINKY